MAALRLRRRTAGLVRVLDAQDEPPAVGAGEAEVEQGDVGGADVGVAVGDGAMRVRTVMRVATFRDKSETAIIRNAGSRQKAKWARMHAS